MVTNDIAEAEGGGHIMQVDSGDGRVMKVEARASQPVLGSHSPCVGVGVLEYFFTVAMKGLLGPG